MVIYRLPFYLLILFLLGLSGCASDSSKEPEPAKLVDFEPVVKLIPVWQRRVGDQGDDALYLRLTPAIDGENIFAANAKGKVFAFNRVKNKKLWTANVKESLIGAVGAGEGLVLVASTDGLLIALSQADGEERWRTPLSSEMLAAAQIDQGMVVVQTMDGKLAGLGASSGAIRWTYSTSLPSLTLRTSATPIIDNLVVYAAFANGRVIALNTQTGLLLWQEQVSIPQGRNELERLIDFDGKPILSGNDLYVAGYQSNAAGLDKAGGRLQWMEPASAKGALAASPGNLYFTQADDSVVALKMATGRKFWENKEMNLRAITAPAVLGDYLVVVDFDGYLHVLNQENGAFVGRFNMWYDTARNAPISDGETLYLLTDNGKLRAFKLKHLN